MGIFNNNQKTNEQSVEEVVEVVSPAPAVAVEKPKKVKPKKEDKKKPIEHLTPEEKAIYTKNKKEMSAKEYKSYLIIKKKLIDIQGKTVIKQKLRIENPKENKKSINLGKFIFAETILKEDKNLLSRIQNKEYSASGAKGLENLAKSLGLDLKFKVKPKKEA